MAATPGSPIKTSTDVDVRLLHMLRPRDIGRARGEERPLQGSLLGEINDLLDRRLLLADLGR